MVKITTSLKEFPISRHIIRGILTHPNNDTNKIVICLHGFERCSSTESKFKKLSDALGLVGVASLRFDFSGCGLSDGDFKYTTISSQANEFKTIFDQITKEYSEVSVIAHSLGACVIASQIEEVKQSLDKVILLAPALNQASLLRFWFTINKMKKISPEKNITWDNFEKFFDEKEFILDCQRTDKTTKANFINAEYFLQNMDADYSSKLISIKNKIIHIHGDCDITVPFESLNRRFKNMIIVNDGDHDLEKPKSMDQWLNKAVDFIMG